MKHAITIFLLLLLGYFTWREWPRTMKVYQARTEHIPMADWKTADYEPTVRVLASPCRPLIVPTCTVGQARTMTNILVTDWSNDRTQKSDKGVESQPIKEAS